MVPLIWMLAASLLCAAEGPAAKILVAHRGASAYAPEHTQQAYELAIAQGADFVEQDLQMTRDGVLVCLHDASLERTTDVEEVFPDRARRVVEDGKQRLRWFVSDFTLEEVKRLDAGVWMAPVFRGSRILTFREAIRQVRGRAGLFPEIKNPGLYEFSPAPMEQALLDDLRSEGLDPEDPAAPVLVQSFDLECLVRLRERYGSRLRLVYLIPDSRQDPSSLELELRRAASVCWGIGPARTLLFREQAMAGQARKLGLALIPWTFRKGSSLTGFSDSREEMRYFLQTLEVDGLFTDNPDLFPGRKTLED